MPQISETATFILTLLNNIDELVVKSFDKKSASEVMQALRIYAKNKDFPLNEERIDNYFAVLGDARPYTLSMIVKDIADDVMTAEMRNKKSKLSS